MLNYHALELLQKPFHILNRPAAHNPHPERSDTACLRSRIGRKRETNATSRGRPVPSQPVVSSNAVRRRPKRRTPLNMHVMSGLQLSASRRKKPGRPGPRFDSLSYTIVRSYQRVLTFEHPGGHHALAGTPRRPAQSAAPKVPSERPKPDSRLGRRIRPGYRGVPRQGARPQAHRHPSQPERLQPLRSATWHLTTVVRVRRTYDPACAAETLKATGVKHYLLQRPAYPASYSSTSPHGSSWTRLSTSSRTLSSIALYSRTIFGTRNSSMSQPIETAPIQAGPRKFRPRVTIFPILTSFSASSAQITTIAATVSCKNP